MDDCAGHRVHCGHCGASCSVEHYEPVGSWWWGCCGECVVCGAIVGVVHDYSGGCGYSVAVTGQCGHCAHIVWGRGDVAFVCGCVDHVAWAYCRCVACGGFHRVADFWRVELPLAAPVLLAALRVVLASTMSLITVGAVLGVPSLGLLFTDGFQRGIVAEVLTGIVVVLGVAWVLDRAVVALGGWLMPWHAAERGHAGGHSR